MKLIPVVFSALVLSALGFAMPAAALAKLQVVATVTDLAAVAREVGGPDVEVTALTHPSQDPHFVDPRPHLVLALNKADVLVLTGLELESGWLPTLVRGARNAKVQPGGTGYFDASGTVPLKQVPAGKVDRSMGDIHPGGNPHYMADPANGARVARALAQRFATLDPAHRAAYASRANRLATEAEALAAAQKKRFAALSASKRQVVTFHQSLVYLTDWLGLQSVATLEPKPGIPPSPSHIAGVLGVIRTQGVEAILQETYFSTKEAKLLESKSQARLVVLPGGPDFAKGEGYVAYLRGVADRIHAVLAK